MVQNIPKKSCIMLALFPMLNRVYYYQNYASTIYASLIVVTQVMIMYEACNAATMSTSKCNKGQDNGRRKWVMYYAKLEGGRGNERGWKERKRWRESMGEEDIWEGGYIGYKVWNTVGKGRNRTALINIDLYCWLYCYSVHVYSNYMPLYSHHGHH